MADRYLFAEISPYTPKPAFPWIYEDLEEATARRDEANAYSRQRQRPEVAHVFKIVEVDGNPKADQ